MRPTTKRHRIAAGIGTLTMATALMAWSLPTASADAGNPPDAPAGLTVNDRERHLNVEGTPRFGWLPQDPDGNEIQTAYQIRVLDADGAEVWDSGKVDSSEQSYVAYEGPALDPGATYSWTVRTWDRADMASPWAPLANFDTGIGDDDWGDAEWIRRDVPFFEFDDYTLARKEVVVGDSPVVRARSYLAVSQTAELYLNGERGRPRDLLRLPG